jgi:hypothetical protein
LYLKPVDIYNFDFSRLIYIEQLGSYYFMNKIANFVKGKPVRCELIEVDYFTEFEEGNPVTPIVNTVSISNPVISDCEISFDVETTADLPVNVQLIVYAGEFSLFGGGVVYNEFILAEPLVVSLSGSTATFPITALPFNFYGYKFAIALLTENIFDGNISGLSEVVAIDGSCFIEPDYPETLTLNAVTFIGNIPNFPFADLRRFNLTYSYTGMPTGQAYTLRIWYYAVLFGSPVWGYNDISRGQGQTNEFNITTDVQGIYSMPTKFKIQILDVESNEITL